MWKLMCRTTALLEGVCIFFFFFLEYRHWCDVQKNEKQNEKHTKFCFLTSLGWQFGFWISDTGVCFELLSRNSGRTRGNGTTLASCPVYRLGSTRNERWPYHHRCHRSGKHYNSTWRVCVCLCKQSAISLPLSLSLSLSLSSWLARATGKHFECESHSHCAKAYVANNSAHTHQFSLWHTPLTVATSP